MPKIILVAKLDRFGQLVSSQDQLLKLYQETFTHRLRHRPVKASYKNIFNLKMLLFEKRLKQAELNPAELWTFQQYLKVLHKLKNNKSRDPHNLINEMLKPEYCGNDLLVSLFTLLKQVKTTKVIPKFMEYSTIHTVYKGKGSKLNLDNDRGIFIVNIFRSVLMKLVYNDIYDDVDSEMSDSNVGARKQKGVRNHIFILNGIINDVLHSKKKAIDIQIMDYSQCFDSLSLEECLNDLYEAGVTNDNLSLKYKINEKNQVSIKTPFGVTDVVNVVKVVMQGETLGPLMCAVQVDSIGKQCLETGNYLYSYKNQVDIPPLGMIDDIAAVSDCGVKTVQMNSYLNAKTNLKKLQFGVSKCKHMHVGPKNPCCPDLYVSQWKLDKTENFVYGKPKIVELEVDDHQMEQSSDEKYLGDIISVSGTNNKNIAARKTRGMIIANKICSILDYVCFGHFKYEVLVTLRNSLLVNSILANSSAWYKVTALELHQLEQVDESLMSRGLSAPRTTSSAILYLELGVMPLRFIVMYRRIMFLHYIVNQSETSLIFRFFKCQVTEPTKGDWVLTVQDDLSSLELSHYFYEQLKSISKIQFKKILSEKIKVKCLISHRHKKLSKQDKKHTV